MKINNLCILLVSVSLILMALSCSVSIPENYEESTEVLKIQPDYQDVIIPYNIAPLNFNIDTVADDYITRISSSSGKEIKIRGKKVETPVSEWHDLLEENKGGELLIEIFLKKEGKWYKHPVMKNYISEDPIDEYISYRLIAPSYVTFSELSIQQRNITNFDVRDIYNNAAVMRSEEEQCINCHSYQNYKTDNMQFHARQLHGGTLIVSDGVAKKVNIKTGNLISGGVYPAWHPTEKLIAYSVNSTGQFFHAKDIQKIEVLDSESDLVLYDVLTDEVSVIRNDSNSFETFPAWSPDGKTLYYASAHFEPKNSESRSEEVALNYQKMKYDILRMDFDIQSRKFGVPDTVFKASDYDLSATLPRISPDGKYLLFTLGEYGTFHIWHSSSDLVLLDLETGKIDFLKDVNSNNVESYHTWSSNGRWIIFSSRRDDGSYTRPYIAYFDRDGKGHKPFILPQKDPDFYKQFYKSYNIPEFMVEPVKLSVKDFAGVLKGKTIQTVLRGEYNTSAENDTTKKENLY